MLGRRRIRIAVGIFVVAAVWNLIWTRATSYVSTYAVIDAPLVSVHAPTDGTIVTASPALGSGVSPDVVLLEMTPRESSALDINRLSGDILAAESEVAALGREIAATRKAISGLLARHRAESEIEVAYLTQKLLEAEERRERHLIEWDRASEELDRQRRLKDGGGVSAVRIREAEFDLLLVDAMIAEADAQVAAIRIELEAIEAALPSPGGTGRRDAANDRLDDMQQHLADLATRRDIALGRLQGLELRLSEESGNSRNATRFAPKAATVGVVWRESPPPGASATRGTKLAEVLDCRRRFVEVVLSESVFERLASGTVAEVRLKGAEAAFSAAVAFRRAEGTGSAIAGQDALPANAPAGAGVRAFLSLPPADVTDPGVAARFCDVGRTAEVTIARPNLSERFPRVADFFRELVSEGRLLAGRLVSRLTG